ncbi:MAG: hypothetical protein K6E50_08855 [Lachnospiraceae bacterium]|nr:hypothetical protein [Lachnospiraceae bacterium]
MDAQALKRLNSGRRSDRPESLGEERSEGPHFSQVLAELAEKHAPSSLRAAGEEESTPALSDKQIRGILKNALSSESISPDIVKALTDEDGRISEKLLDLIMESGDEDEDEAGLFGEDTDEALNKLLTDRLTAQEYLSSQSGRNLIVALADRSLSGLIS